MHFTNIAEFILFKLNEDKIKQVNELLIGKIKAKKKKIVSTIGEMCIDEFTSDDMIIKQRGKLRDLDTMLGKLEYDPLWLFKVDFDEFLGMVSGDFSKERHELETEITKILFN